MFVHQKWPIAYPTKRITCLSLKRTIVCPSKSVTCLSLKMTKCLSIKNATCLSLKNDKVFVPQKGPVACMSLKKDQVKRAISLSLKKNQIFVTQKGLLVCHSKRVTCLSHEKGYLFIKYKIWLQVGVFAVTPLLLCISQLQAVYIYVYATKPHSHHLPISLQSISLIP